MTKQNNLKFFQICPPGECDNEVYTAQVKSKEMNFCCLKGFKKSLKDFEKHMANKIKR